MEQRIRNRSARITGLPQWKSDVSSLPVEAVSLSKSKPFHPVLLELFHQPTPMTPSLQIERALKVYQDHGSNELTTKDFMFVLETIQDHASSQEQFLESIVTLIRSSSASHRESVKIVTTKGSSPPVDWNQAIASALSRVYWSQKQEVLFAQILHAKTKDEALEEQFQKKLLSRSEEQGQGRGNERPRRLFAPFMATHQIMALTMVESLLHKFNAGYALDLYAQLIELGIHMPGRVMSALVRVAVHSGDGYQLEKIGNLLVSEHQIPSMDRPPLILTAKLMDSFVHGVCEHELYELARDVFNKGLEAGGQYRAHTFTRILNSLSVKDFGFDIVNAATAAEKGKRKGGKGERPSAPTDLPVASKSRKAIAVADPKEVERYIQLMEQHSVQPTITTLNVLAKLYLEMAQYKVAGAPSWKSAFRRYNPLGLVPDVVTNNILLAYYERHKDLNTMLQIYNDMAGELEDGVAAGGLLRKGRKKKTIIDTILPVPQDHQAEAKEEQSKEDETQDQDQPQRLTPLQLEQMAEQEELKRLEEQATREQLTRQRQKRGRSQRDIYTYNTMLHALLQHAVESKDIAAIGQCFHDMEQDGISADTVTFNTNILYHIASGDLASAVQVFRSMQEDVARGCETSSPTLDEFFVPSKPLKSRPSYAGSSVATPLTPTTPAPDVVSLTSMISGFVQASQMDQATLFFREMTDTFKIEPNLKTYSALVAGLHRAGDHDRAERLWDIVLKEDDLAQQEALERASQDLGEEDASEGYERHGRNQRRNLTVMERRQIEARRKLFRESLKE